MRLKKWIRRLLEWRLDRRYEKSLQLYEMNYDTRLEDEEEGSVLTGQEDSVDFEILVFGE